MLRMMIRQPEFTTVKRSWADHPKGKNRDVTAAEFEDLTGRLLPASEAAGLGPACSS